MKQILFVFVFMTHTIALADIANYSCVFSEFSNSSGLQKANESEPFMVLVDGEAAYFGRASDEKYKFIVVHDREVLSMYQIGPTGNLNSITIDGDLSIVYSRNTVMLGSLRPSQYYGTCKKT